MNRVWNLEKKQWHHKKADLAARHQAPDEVNGILVSDERLEECIGNPVVEPVILGGIQATHNMKEFLKLPLKFRSPQILDKREHNVQVEARAAKERWTI